MVRVCPKRDAVCSHGMNCPYVIDCYECQEETNPMTNETELPERIWAWKFMKSKQTDVMVGGWDKNDDRKLKEYVSAELFNAQAARIAELEAKLAKAMGWHPIDTAPTDEAVLICGGDVLYPFVASLNNGEWDAEAQGGILREDIAECPTHWMPLPAPPSQN